MAQPVPVRSSLRKAPYQSPFVKYITEYQRGHSNALQLACIVAQDSDVGFASPLAAYFSHIHLHLAGDSTHAREQLSQQFAEHWEQGRFSFSTGRLADAPKALAQHSVDLVLFDDCAHHAGTSDLTAAAKEMLTPNGCVVFTRYNFSNVPKLQCDRHIFYEKYLPIYEELAQKCEAKLVKDVMVDDDTIAKQNSGLDFIDLDPEHFYENVTKRVGINGAAIGGAEFGSQESSRLAWRKRDGERLISLWDDPMCKSLRKDASHDLLGQIFQSRLGEDYDERIRTWIEDMHRHLHASGLETIWSAVLVMGTRNMNEDLKDGKV